MSFKFLFIYPNTMMATLIPLNISILSSVLKRNDIDVELFDTTYYRTEDKSYEEKRVELLQIKKFSYADGGVKFKEGCVFDGLSKKVKEYKPDLIGITLVEDTFCMAEKLLESIANLEIPVVAGGVYANFDQDKIINNPNIDYLCVGEGEGALVDLCVALRDGTDTTCIDNICTKKSGEIIKNTLRPLEDLDELPFADFSIFEEARLCRPMQGRLFKMLHVEYQRGCPYNCTYCGAPGIRKMYRECGYKNYLRTKSPQRFINELLHLKELHNPDYLTINAESFLAAPVSELKELARLYKKVNLPFYCQSRPETVTEQKIALLKEMGCADMQFGIEHGNEEFRKKMLNRHCSNREIIEALKIVERYEIPYTVNNIIGFPHETRELIFETITLNRELKPKSINCFMMTPYRGTYLREYCIAKGYLNENASTQRMLDGAEMAFEFISREELKGLQRTFSLYARLPKEDYPLIELAEKFDEYGNSVFAELSEKYYELFFN